MSWENLTNMQTDSGVLIEKSEKSAVLDICALLQKHEGRNYELHSEHINPANVRTLRTIGFDRCYVRAGGPIPLGCGGDKISRFSLPVTGFSASDANHPEMPDID